MSAVKKAEQRIHDAAKTKTYKGVVGNKEFSQSIVDLALGGVVDKSRIRCVNGAGGTGALMILMWVLGRARPKGKIYISDPSWPNHWPVAENANLTTGDLSLFRPEDPPRRFRGDDEGRRCVDPDDILLLHGCCHNPTGANLTPAQWDRVAASLKRTGAFPLIDLAYLGFGDGIEAGRLWRAQGGELRAREHDRLFGEQEFRALSRAYRRCHRHRQGRGGRPMWSQARCRTSSAARSARRPTMAPRSCA